MLTTLVLAATLSGQQFGTKERADRDAHRAMVKGQYEATLAAEEARKAETAAINALPPMDWTDLKAAREFLAAKAKIQRKRQGMTLDHGNRYVRQAEPAAFAKVVKDNPGMTPDRLRAAVFDYTRRTAGGRPEPPSTATLRTAPAAASTPATHGGPVQVRSYTRKDGITVKAHTRSR